MTKTLGRRKKPKFLETLFSQTYIVGSLYLRKVEFTSSRLCNQQRPLQVYYLLTLYLKFLIQGKGNTIKDNILLPREKKSKSIYRHPNTHIPSFFQIGWKSQATKIKTKRTKRKTIHQLCIINRNKLPRFWDQTTPSEYQSPKQVMKFLDTQKKPTIPPTTS